MDLSKFTSDRTKFNYDKKINNIKYTYLNKFSDLKKIFSNKKVLLAGMDSIDFKSLKIQFFLNFFNIKRIFISDLGYIPTEMDQKNYSFDQKTRNFYNIKLPYYILRILCLFHLVKNIDFFFEASQSRIDQINQSISKKIDSFLNLNISFYKKIFRINSKIYDDNKKIFQKRKFIVYCDSGFDHPDKIKREGKVISKDREIYYSYLYKFLKDLGTLYNKKVLFCKHPKNIYPKNGNYNLIKKNFEIIESQSDKYLIDAEIAVFHVSTLISKAIYFKKKIILIHSSLVGKYLNNRSMNWIKKTNIYNVELAKNYTLDKSKLEKHFIENLKNLKKFNDYDVVSNFKLSRSTQIKKVLIKNYFNM